MVDAFIGRYKVETRENFEGFMKGNGVPDEYIQMGKNAEVISEFSKNGDVITITRKRPKRTTENSFRLGEETEIDTIKGDKAKVIINIEDGKLVVKGKEYKLIAELIGGNLKETFTLKGHTMTRFSNRL